MSARRVSEGSRCRSTGARPELHTGRIEWHVLLGHWAEGRQTDADITPRSLREVEAESVAMLVCSAPGCQM
jgi:hypothetical protein